MCLARAVDGMYEERHQVFSTFAVGIFSLIGAMTFGAFLTLHIEVSVCATVAV